MPDKAWESNLLCLPEAWGVEGRLPGLQDPNPSSFLRGVSGMKQGGRVHTRFVNEGRCSVLTQARQLWAAAQRHGLHSLWPSGSTQGCRAAVSHSLVTQLLLQDLRPLRQPAHPQPGLAPWSQVPSEAFLTCDLWSLRGIAVMSGDDVGYVGHLPRPALLFAYAPVPP